MQSVVLGEFKTWNSLLSIQNEFKDIVDPAENNKVIVKDAPNTVPDQIMLQGTTTVNAPVAVHWRGGPPFPGTPGIDWRIQGRKGELRLISSSCALNVGRSDTKIEWYDAENGLVEELLPDHDEFEDLPMPARNIGRQYEAFRKGEWNPDFDWAVRRHEMLEEMWERFDKAQK